AKQYQIMYFRATCLRCQREVQLFHERPKSFAESFIDGSEFVRSFKMLAINATAGADVIAHFFQPGELIWIEANSGTTLLFQPTSETFAHVFFEWFERSCWFDGSAD